MRISAGEVARRIEDVTDGIVRLAMERAEAAAPSTVLRTVPLPRFAWEDNRGGK
jgi:hypothetical protein